MSTTEFEFEALVYYDHDAKQRFHRAAKRQLKALAACLRLKPSEYDLRSNMGGIAVSGEITLHSDNLYVQVDQSVMGSDKGILIRTCKGRKDYVGGQNHFAPLALLNRPVELATLINQRVRR